MEIVTTPTFPPYDYDVKKKRAGRRLGNPYQDLPITEEGLPTYPGL